MKSSFETLTPREREIMGLVASGLMNKQVAGKIPAGELFPTYAAVLPAHDSRKLQLKFLLAAPSS